MLKVPPPFPLMTASMQLLKLSWSLSLKSLGKVIFIRQVDAKMVSTSSVSTLICVGGTVFTPVANFKKFSRSENGTRSNITLLVLFYEMKRIH